MHEGLSPSLKPLIPFIVRGRDALIDSTIFLYHCFVQLASRAWSTLTCDTQKFFHAASKLVLEYYIAHCVHYVYEGARETYANS